MTLMNTEPAAASHARLCPNARGAATRSLLRAGIASAPASLFLVLICGLAYANTSAGLSVNVVPSGSPPTANFVANFNDVHQTIDGFGGADMFVGAMPSATIDSLFCVNATDPGCSNPGIGLTLLRQNLGEADTQSNATAVVARGGKVWETPLGVPTPSDASTYNASANNIISQVNTLTGLGVPIYAVATQNEPDCGCNGGTVWSAAQTAAFAAVLGPKLHALTPSVKLISPEAVFLSDWSGFISAIEGDPTANAQTDIFSFHQYGGLPPVANDHTRHVWETEDAISSGNGNLYDTSIGDAVVNGVAEWVYDALVNYDANAWHFWWAWYPDFSVGSNDQIYVQGNITKRYFAYGNWSRYARPGWVRVGVSGSLSGLYGVAAFENPSTGAFAIIAINNSGTDIQNVSFAVSGASVTGSVTPYVTSGTPIGALGSDGNLSAGSASSNVPASLPVSGGVFKSTVPYGVTTFVGQVIPASAICQLGNHGPVRGWAHVANGTLVADDGCLLQMGYSNEGDTLSAYKDLHDNGHYNTIRYSIFLGGWYNDSAPGQTITDIENQLDNVISLAQQTGLYVLVDNHNTLNDPTGNNYGCPDWSADVTIWTAIAPRYANNTNVIYQIQNEPDWCGTDDYSVIAQNEDSLYKLIRSYAPNTPILAWTFANPTWVNRGGGLGTVIPQAPDVNYANATVDFHPYGAPPDATAAPSDVTNFVNTARADGYPVTMSEYGVCVGSAWNTMLSTLQSLGVSWSCGDGYPDSTPGQVITWPAD